MPKGMRIRIKNILTLQEAEYNSEIIILKMKLVGITANILVDR